MTGFGSLVFAQLEIENLGLVRMFTPIAVPLVLPAIGGVGVATACTNYVRLALPDPLRAAANRALWASCWTLAAVVACCAAITLNPATNTTAITRNTLVFATLGLLTLSLGYPHLAWLPVMTYTISCMLFGYSPSRHEYYWWSVIVQRDVTAGQLLVVLALFVGAGLMYALQPRRIRMNGIHS